MAPATACGRPASTSWRRNCPSSSSTPGSSRWRRRSRTTSRKVTVFVANRFKLDWVRAQYAGRIAAMLEKLYGQPVQLELALAPRETTCQDLLHRPLASRTVPRRRSRPTSGDDAAAGAFKNRLNTALTFDTLVEGTANRMARAAAMHVSGMPGQLYNPLFIYGGVGLGKTHLMHAVGNRLLADRPGSQSSLHPCRAVRLGCGQGLPAQDFRRVQGALPLARPAADRRRPVLRQQGPHAGRVLQRLRGAAGQEVAHRDDHRTPIPRAWRTSTSGWSRASIRA